jgi:hypothetical protein
MPLAANEDMFADDHKLSDKVHLEYTEGRIVRATVRDLFAAGVLSKTAYIALILRLEQPTDGTFQDIETMQFADELTFEAADLKGKEKTFTVSPTDVEVAIATLQKKGCLQCDKPPIQLQIALHY